MPPSCARVSCHRRAAVMPPRHATAVSRAPAPGSVPPPHLPAPPRTALAPILSLFPLSSQLVSFICPVDHKDTKATPMHCGSYETSCDPWAVPAGAIGPLLYWILFNSCAAYLLMTWANHHARAGFVLAYCALQPLVSVTLSAIIDAAAPSTDLQMPGLNALGAIGIVVGLGFILVEGRRQHERDTKHALLVHARGETPQPQPQQQQP